ncbi:unnamed protein product, partial [Brassica rapa subsp. narinosa]
TGKTYLELEDTYGGDEDDDNDTKICPDFEKIVATKVREWTKKDSSLGPALLRLLFHDCASRDATFQLGGPYWPNAYGRRDSTDSYARDVEKVPSGRRDITALLETFQSYGLNVLDLVVLSGAHTIGKAYCGTIQSRLYNFNATYGTDPSIDSKYADFLRRKCRVASETVYLDAATPVKFDNQYYINLQKNMRVLTTDQELVKDPRTAPLVKAFAEQPPHMFRQQFAVSMTKLVNVGVITGEDRVGVIRKVCSKSNSRPY